MRCAKGNKKVLVKTCCVMAIACYFAPALFAAGNLSLGRVQVSPFLVFKQEYRSNIYLTPEDEISDMITHISPGVLFRLPERRGDYELSYNADILYYSDNSREDTVRHMFFFQGDTMLGKDFDFLIRNRYHVTDDPATSELTEREDRTRNTFEVKLTRPGNLLTLGAGFTSAADDYKTRDNLDKKDSFFTLEGYYRFLPRTDLKARYRRGEIRYDTDSGRNASYDELTAGVSGELSPKITGEMRAGYQKRSYDDPARESFSGGVVYASVAHELNARVRTELSLSRGAEESTFSNNSYYVFNRAGVNYRHFLGVKNALLLGVGYETASYPVRVEGERRDDSILSFTLGWDYDLKNHIKLGARYEYMNRDSDFSPHNYDYADNRVSVSLRVEF